MQNFTELKQKHRAVWASGDYDQIARGVQAVANHVVRSARIRAGERVLDTLPAEAGIQRLPRVRGGPQSLESLTPELLTIARERAADAGYDDMTWKEGDAENLPFSDGTFDVVASSCGLMFTPDQHKTANEVVALGP
jgi:hypothetical protein